jgi:hypothetical protein
MSADIVESSENFLVPGLPKMRVESLADVNLAFIEDFTYAK